MGQVLGSRATLTWRLSSWCRRVLHRLPPGCSCRHLNKQRAVLAVLEFKMVTIQSLGWIRHRKLLGDIGMCGMCPSSDPVLKETLISKIHLQTFAPFEGNSYLCPCAASNLDFMSLVSIHVSILSFRFKSCPKHGSRYCKECPVTETTFSRQKHPFLDDLGCASQESQVANEPLYLGVPIPLLIS